MKKFNELTDYEKNVLVERHRDINVCTDTWAVSVIEAAKTMGVTILSFDVETEFYCNIDKDDTELSWYWLDKLEERYNALTSDTAVMESLSKYEFTGEMDDIEMI